MPKLRFLLDENVPVELGAALADRGHDVASVSADLRSADDPTILAFAVREVRVLLTFDTDFGTLVFKERLAVPPSIVLIRLHAKQLAEELATVAAAIETAVGQGGRFVVIGAEGVRVRPMSRTWLH